METLSSRCNYNHMSSILYRILRILDVVSTLKRDQALLLWYGGQHSETRGSNIDVYGVIMPVYTFTSLHIYELFALRFSTGSLVILIILPSFPTPTRPDQVVDTVT